MVTMHPDPSPNSSSFLNDEPWLAFNMLQTCIDVELVHPMTAADYALSPTKPAVMAEGGYEGLQFGRLNTPLGIRRQAYWTFLAGGHHVYGHNLHYQDIGTWRNWIDSPGSTQVGMYRTIVESLPQWWDVVPDQSIIQAGGGSGLDLAASAHSKLGDWAAVYFSSPRTASIRMDRIRTSEITTAYWVSPIDGSRALIGHFPYDRPVELTTPNGWEDALLLLEANTDGNATEA
jgi:hypothetical protein